MYVEIICNLSISHTTIVKWFYEIVIAWLFLSPVTFVYPVSEVKRGKGNRETEELLPVLWKIITVLTYSTVDKDGCGVVRFNADFFFCFTITLSSPSLNRSFYSQYQFFLFETIIEQREKDKTFNQIAEWLNEKGYLSVRGKKFRAAHVHSIVKKKRLRDKKFEKEYPEVRSDFHLDIFDRTLINMVKSDD